MVFLNIKYCYRKGTAEQTLRDDSTTTAHNEAVARGEARILATCSDGNLHSYRPEEYGAERGGPLPLTSVLGHIAWTGVWAFALAGIIGATVAGLIFSGADLRDLKLLEDNGWIGLLMLFVLVAAFGVFIVLGPKDLIKEARAARVRTPGPSPAHRLTHRAPRTKHPHSRRAVRERRETPSCMFIG